LGITLLYCVAVELNKLRFYERTPAERARIAPSSGGDAISARTPS
jgi:hypothetical protein